MKHYIIVKFIDTYDYKKYITDIKKLFNKALTIKNISEVNIYSSNSNLKNRHDIMIEMILTEEALKNFDNSIIHKEWKEQYGNKIANKTIFDCQIK